MPETPDVETSSAEYAQRFSGRAGEYLLRVQAETMLRAIADLRPGTVLDVGGGHGQLVEPLRSAGWRVTVHGSVDECGDNLRNVHGVRSCDFVAGDLFDLPFADRSFDLVIAVRLLSHVRDWRRLAAEMARVAGRSVVLEYPSLLGLQLFAPLLFELKRSYEGDTRPFTRYRTRDLRTVFAPHGFEAAREFKQLVMPVVVHRAARGSPLLQRVEAVSRAVGLTAIAGSPVILRLDRHAEPVALAAAGGNGASSP